jgi:transcriptional regulator with XRE-family HTH domain
MRHAGVNNVQLAAACNISKQAVGQLLLGKSADMKALNCALAAKYLGVDCVWLAAGEGEMLATKQEENMPLSQQEKDVIVALRVLGEQERAALMRQVVDLARSQMGQLQALIERQDSSATVLPIKRRQ